MIKKWGFFKSRALPTEFGALWLLRITMVVPLVLSLTFQPLFAYAQTPSPSPNMKALLAQYGKPCNIPKDLQTDAIKEQCTAIKLSKRTIKVESSKIAISTAGLAILIALAAVEEVPFAQAVKGICNGIGYGLLAANTAADITTAIINGKEAKDSTQSMTEAFSKIGATATGVLMGQMMGNAGKTAASTTSTKVINHSTAIGPKPDGSNLADNATKSKSPVDNAAKAACKGHAISLGVSLIGMAGSLTMATMTKKKSEKTAEELGISLSDTMNLNPQVPSFNNGLVNTGSSKVNMPSAVVEKMEANNENTAGSDAAKEALSALGVSKQANQLLSKALGQDLAKFAANAPTDPSKMSNYVAGALGLGSAGAAAIDRTKDKIQEIAKKNGLLEKLGIGYASVGKNAPSSDSSDPDFNKLMQDMMKALNPGEEESAQNAGEDPAEAAFRRMELLPPEKIEANKDISLFARIGFRYRKALPKVDELNWAIPENQSAGNPRLPAQDSQTGQSRR